MQSNLLDNIISKSSGKSNISAGAHYIQANLGTQSFNFLVIKVRKRGSKSVSSKFRRICVKCQKTFKSRQSLCNHKKVCKVGKVNTEENIDSNSFDEDRSKFFIQPQLDLLSSQDTDLLECSPSYSNTVNEIEIVTENSTTEVQHDRDLEQSIGHQLLRKICQSCLKTFKSSQSLCNHKKRCRGLTVADRSFTCPKKFKSTQALSKHSNRESDTEKENIESDLSTSVERVMINNQPQINLISSQDKCLTKCNSSNTNTVSEKVIETDKSHLEIQRNHKLKQQHGYQQSLRKSCPDCLKTYKSSQSLSNHKNRCRGVVVVRKCFGCQKVYKSAQSLFNHKKRCRGQPIAKFICSTCQKIFKTRRTLNNHKSRCRGIAVNKLHCPICLKTYKTHQSLYNHKKRHERSL